MKTYFLMEENQPEGRAERHWVQAWTEACQSNGYQLHQADEKPFEV